MQKYAYITKLSRVAEKKSNGKEYCHFQISMNNFNNCEKCKNFHRKSEHTSVSEALVCLMVTLLLFVMVAQMEMDSPGT